ncbi:MAG TPA: hypothetical protein VH593_13605 [Ktedonobacteraceae bacterium]
MNNAVAALMRITILAGGAVMGALLARWVDDLVASQSQHRSDYDKSRYSQGLSPISSPPSKNASNVYTIHSTTGSEDNA